MIVYKTGNIIYATEDIICHQVNCLGIVGAGLASQIKEFFPRAYYLYKQFCKENTPIQLLGKAQMVPCGSKIVANLFGQNGVGHKSVQTNYKALHNAIDSVLCEVVHGEYKGKTVAFPYGLGCGLAGGDWSIVSKSIESISDHYRVDVAIYRLKSENA